MSNKKPIANGFHHIAITVKNFDESVKFYSEGLGFKEYLRWGDERNKAYKACMLDVGNNNYIEIFNGRKESGYEGLWQHIAFTTDNCDNLFENAIKSGAKAIKEPSDECIKSGDGAIVYVRIAFCKGLDGEIIEFFQQKE